MLKKRFLLVVCIIGMLPCLHLGALKQTIEKKVKPGENGNTDLMINIFNNKYMLVPEIEKSIKAQQNKPNNYGQTPIQLTKELQKNTTIIKKNNTLYLNVLEQYEKKCSKETCDIEKSGNVPFKSVTATIKSWFSTDMKGGLQQNREHHLIRCKKCRDSCNESKLIYEEYQVPSNNDSEEYKKEYNRIKEIYESCECAEDCTIYRKEEAIRLHTFSQLVDFFIEPLGIKSELEDGNICYRIPGKIAITAPQENLLNEYNGFFVYIIGTDSVLYHRFFEVYPTITSPKKIEELKRDAPQIYSIIKPNKKEKEDFFSLDRKNKQTHLFSGNPQDLDYPPYFSPKRLLDLPKYTCICEDGLATIKIKDKGMDLYLFNFNSSGTKAKFVEKETKPQHKKEISTPKKITVKLKETGPDRSKSMGDDRPEMNPECILPETKIEIMPDEVIKKAVESKPFTSKEFVTTAQRKLNDDLKDEVLKKHPSLQVIEDLLKKGANPNITVDFLGNVPLMRAINSKNRDLIKLLLKYNAPINQQAIELSKEKNIDLEALRKE